MKFTLNEMNGLLNGKCLPSDLIVGETLAEYLVRKFSALEQRLIESERYGRQTDITIDNLELKLAQMAAENAGLKEWSPNPHSASMFEAIEKAEKLMDDGMPELAMIEAFEILKMKRTPATDAFLAEVRAQGVDSAINTVISMMNHQHPVTSKTIDILRVHAYQLRKGVQS